MTTYTCDTCGRSVVRDPVFFGGLVMGRTCARRAVPSARAEAGRRQRKTEHRARRAQPDTRQPDLFPEVQP